MDDRRETKELFLELVERTPEERERALAELDPETAERVRGLLEAYAQSGDLTGDAAALGLVSTPGAPTGSWSDELVADATVGPYTLREQIGEGGFGTVWIAEQSEPVVRRVALKVLKAGLDTREVVTRFEAERQALALMDHPGIARVFDGGATERGRPWFAMELVDGPSITKYADARGLSMRERLELFLSVCRAVQHAHQKGVIHRDIKPSNVLVADVDGVPQPKVIDFGIAKAIDQRLTEKTLMTQGGQLIGTPAYMSPEQVEGGGGVDTRVDVYALGTLLYELLAGRTPFTREELREAGFDEVRRLIREVDPPRPSMAIGGETATHVTRRQVEGDLDWIVMRCLEKERERRYDSVAVLANDVERHLSGSPVLAGPPDLSYRVSKFVRRHRLALAAAVVFVGLLVGGIVAASVQASRARAAEVLAREAEAEAREAEIAARTAEADARAAEAERAREAERALIELDRAERVAEFLEHVLLGIDPAVARGRDTELLESLLGVAERQIAEKAEGNAEVEATIRRILGGAYIALGRVDEATAQLERALELREATLGPDAPDTLQSLEDLGGAHLAAGRWDEAVAVFERCLEGRAATLGAEHRDTLHAKMNLGSALHEAADDERAELLLRELLVELEREYGPTHEDTLLVVNNLAGALEDLGRPEEALALYRRALEGQLTTKPHDHPHVLAALNNLGAVYAGLGRWEEAEPLIAQALETKRRILPEGHPSVLVSMNNLARLYERQERWEEADAMGREAVELARAHLGQRRETWVLEYNRGNLLLRLERWDEARALLESVVAARDALGADDPVVLSAESALGEALLALGDPSAAEVWTRRAAETAVDALPAGADLAGLARARHGFALAALGELERARAFLVEARALLAESGPERYLERVETELAALEDL